MGSKHKRTKYLSQIIEEKHLEVKGNTLIVAPVGSGKTHYILNVLRKNRKCLYLCDTTNLKMQVLKEDGTCSWEEPIYDSDVTVMTYSRLGSLIKYDNGDLFSNYDLVVADEVHNLIDYQNFDNSKNLETATEYLLKEYDNTQIVFFTATPKYLDIMCEKYPNFDRNFSSTIDLSDNEEIKRYENKRKAYINHYTDVEKQLIQYDGYFKMGYKCLIYTQTIKDMLKLEDMSKRLRLNPICIWSVNNEDMPMNDEQLKVREAIINDGLLIDEYNVLIINRSMETGVNIYDDKMQLMVANTTNEVQQIQARGRIRNDIDLLVLKTKESEKIDFIIENRTLDKWLKKETIIQEVVIANNMRNKNGYIGIRAILNGELLQYGYTIEKKIMEKKKYNRVTKETVYKITKINENTQE